MGEGCCKTTSLIGIKWAWHLMFFTVTVLENTKDVRLEWFCVIAWVILCFAVLVWPCLLTHGIINWHMPSPASEAASRSHRAQKVKHVASTAKLPLQIGLYVIFSQGCTSTHAFRVKQINVTVSIKIVISGLSLEMPESGEQEEKKKNITFLLCLMKIKWKEMEMRRN